MKVSEKVTQTVKSITVIIKMGIKNKNKKSLKWVFVIGISVEELHKHLF